MAEFTVTDPFTQVYDAIMDALSAEDSPLTGLVERWIDMTDPAFKDMPKNSNCDELPEVILYPAEWFITGGNANAYLIQQSYAFRAASSQLRIVTINKVKWAFLKALTALEPKLGLDFVVDWSISQATDSPSDRNENRGEERWTTLSVISVEMKIPRTALLE